MINEKTKINKMTPKIRGTIPLAGPFSFFIKLIMLKIMLSKPVITAVKNSTWMRTAITPSGCRGANI